MLIFPYRNFCHSIQAEEYRLMMPCLTHTFRAWTAPARVSMRNPSRAKSPPWRRELLKRLSLFKDFLAQAPYLNLSSIATLHAAFRPCRSITTMFGWCIFTAAGNITAWDNLQKNLNYKKQNKSCFPACLSSLAGSPSAQRKLHCQISDTEAATPCCQGSLCLDEHQNNITARI